MNIVRKTIDLLLANTLLGIGHVLSKVLLRVTIIGRENIPQQGPVIVTANHFSWFDAPLLTLCLPLKPAFLVATESRRFWYVRMFMRAFESIPIWRGTADRNAIRAALLRLNQGQSVGIFPEGGIDPVNAGRRDQGEQIREASYVDTTSRTDAQLTFPQPGTAYLAVQSKARILPVGLIGTERILDNIIRFRRTEVIVSIGQSFGPLDLAPSLNKHERRQHMDLFAQEIMQRIAMLFPPENQGPYREVKSEAG